MSANLSLLLSLTVQSEFGRDYVAIIITFDEYLECVRRTEVTFKRFGGCVYKVLTLRQST